MASMDELAASLNRQVTDDEGAAIEENVTPQEESPTSEEKTTVEEDAQAEKPAESEEKEPEPESKEDEILLEELASDDTGKRYVPESRFKEVYGKGKAAERRAEQAERRVLELESQGYTPKEAKQIAEKPLDQTAQLEIELLRATLPQFNPSSPDYSLDLDKIGYKNYLASRDNKGNYTITRLEAARQALDDAKRLQSKVAKVTDEARAVKSQQSDQGITSRVASRGATSDVPGEDASPEELEGWLKAHGQW